MNDLAILAELQAYNDNQRDTVGLDKATIERFLGKDPKLSRAIQQAHEAHRQLRATDDATLRLPEAQQIAKLQESILNFYSQETVNPYVPLAACGPWIITTCGAVVHDSGGYGMLGFGHAPEEIIKVMAGAQVMANVMTASFSQKHLVDRLRREIGFRRSGAKRHPFSQFVCMNSGSESVSVGARISDVNAKIMTDPGGRHAGKKIMQASHRGSFHGRTDRPAQWSHSSMKKYETLASFRDRKNLLTIVPNEVESLSNVFTQAQRDGVFIEALFLEPVMGEGNPGVAITPQFYRVARELTKAHGALLLVDSIQAGLRAQGCLSICDYPGFEELEGPDMETYSKALNAGQYPLSILALSESAARLYKVGIYGNTMTTNPRALDVACAVLDMVTPELRRNIVERGLEFKAKLQQLAKEVDGIVDVQGTGLLFAAELDPKKFKVIGFGAVEEYMRKRGIGVIHGGANALRFTPHFGITSEEVDLILGHLREALNKGPSFFRG